jgi:hypothetical protein
MPLDTKKVFEFLHTKVAFAIYTIMPSVMMSLSSLGVLQNILSLIMCICTQINHISFKSSATYSRSHYFH